MAERRTLFMNDHHEKAPMENLVQRVVGDAEEFVRREPVKAAAAAFGAGLLMNLLPTRFIVGTVTLAAIKLARPALLTLGVIKAMELCSPKVLPRSPSVGVPD